MPQEPLDVDRLFRQRMPRRDLLRYTGMGLGVSAILAACKQASTSGVAIPSGSARPGIDTEPGGLKVYDWSGYGNGDYFPKEEKQFLWSRYQKADRRHSEVLPVRRTTTPGSPRWRRGRPTTSSTRAPTASRTTWTSVRCRPWDTSLIPNFSQLNPALEKAGQIDGKQYFIVEDWELLRRCYRADKVTPGTLVVLFDNRYAGKISWINTLEMLVIAAYLNGASNPGHDRRGARRAEAVPDPQEAARQGLLGSVLRAVPGLQAEEVWIGYAWPDAYAYAKGAGWTSST